MKKNRHKIITLAILTALTTAIIHIMNKMIAATAVLKDMLHISDKNYYHWRFGNIYFTKQGHGSPVLLLHDLTAGSSGYEWNQIEKHLSTEHTVFTLDLIGCGRSDKPKITYTNFLYVQLICDFIKNVIKEKTDVIVCGLSSSFAIMACHNENEIFGKIMMINPPAIDALKAGPDKKKKLYKFIIEIPVFGTLIYHMITCQENIQNLFMEKYFYNPFHVTSDMIDAYYEGSHRNSANAKFLYSSIISHYVNLNIVHGLKSINNSLILITGDTESQKELTKEYLELNPAIEYSFIPKTKYLPHMENPEVMMEQIGIYL